MSSVPTFARSVYNRRDVPKRPEDLSAWLATEFQNVQRALPPTKSRTVMQADAVQTTDCVVYCDATHGAFTLTLPQPAQAQNLLVTIKKVDASGNAITIGGTVDGTVNPTLATQYKSMTIQSSGTAYYKLASV